MLGRGLGSSAVMLGVMFQLLLPGQVPAQSLMDLFKGNGDGKAVKEKVYGGDPLAKKKVAILNIKGVILSQKMPMAGAVDMVERLRQQLEHAGKDKNLAGVLLEIDSPGGGITASDILHEAVLDLRKKGKKVVVLMEDVAASGGYFIAAGADKIYAHPTTITGSIGVIVKSVNVEGLFEKIGLEDVTLKSTRTPFKDMLSSTRQMTEAERKVMIDLIDQMYDHFIDVIVKGRKMKRKKVLRLADGRVYTAEEAKKSGLIDGIGYRKDALKALYDLAELKKEPKVVKYRRSFNIQDFLSGGAGSRAELLLLNQLQSGLRTPRFMYLWEP